MLILLYLIVICLAIFVAKSLFNSEWREFAQRQIDGIKNERLFWRLIDSDVLYPKIENVHDGYFSRGKSGLSAEMKKADPVEIARTIISPKNSLFKNIKVLNAAIADREKAIDSYLKNKTIPVTESEIKKALERHKFFSPSNTYERMSSVFLNLTRKEGPITEASIWAARKFFNEGLDRSWSENEFGKFARVRIGMATSDLIGDKANGAPMIKEALREREGLLMLRECIVDYLRDYGPTSKAQRALWRIVELVV